MHPYVLSRHKILFFLSPLFFSKPFIFRDQDNIKVRDVLCAFQAVEKVFAVPNGFYWQTVETDEKYFPNGSDMEACRDIDTEVKKRKNNKMNKPLLSDLWDDVGS